MADQELTPRTYDDLLAMFDAAPVYEPPTVEAERPGRSGTSAARLRVKSTVMSFRIVKFDALATIRTTWKRRHSEFRSGWIC